MLSSYILVHRNADANKSSNSSAYSDISSALASGGLSALLQVSVISRNKTGDSNPLLMATANTSSPIYLPATYPNNGSHVPLGDPEFGYPAALYPNITYNSTAMPDPMDPSRNATAVYAFMDTPLNASSVLVLGPMQVNTSFALLSMTLPIVDNSNSQIVLGFMTVVASASSLIDVTNSREGLANTGVVLIIGPSRRPNRFAGSQIPFGNNIIPSAEACKRNPSAIHFLVRTARET